MSQALFRRLTKLEDTLVVGEERQRIERLKRFCYNLPRVSDLSLIVGMRAKLGEIKEPEWLQRELYKPIPSDAPKRLVDEATSWAKQPDDGQQSGDEHFEHEMEKLIVFYGEIAGRRLHSLGDVQTYIEQRKKAGATVGV